MGYWVLWVRSVKKSAAPFRVVGLEFRAQGFEAIGLSANQVFRILIQGLLRSGKSSNVVQ